MHYLKVTKFIKIILQHVVAIAVLVVSA